MKISEITNAIAVDYARIDLDGFTEAEQAAILAEMDIILTAAKSYITSYTGLTIDELDEYADVTIACLVLCSDMFDNRQMTVDNDNVNKTVQTILGMHRRNLI